jgi:hypothetical protein
LVGNYKIKKWKCINWGDNQVPQKCFIWLVFITYRQTNRWAHDGLIVSFVVNSEMKTKKMYICGNYEEVMFGQDEGLCLSVLNIARFQYYRNVSISIEDVCCCM